MDKDFLTVKEVAEITGVSQQYLYSEFNKKFKKFAKYKGKHKCYSRAILKEFDGAEQEEFQEENSTDLNKVVELLEKQVENLMNQISEKDSQINTLQQLLNQQQQLQLHTQSQLKLLESQEKKSFWSRFRKKQTDFDNPKK